VEISGKYLLFLGTAETKSEAKTASGIVEWRPELCLAQWSLPGCKVDLGLPTMDPAAAYAAGARTLVIGVAPIGGILQPAWLPALIQALEAGLDLAAGMHTRLKSVPEIRDAAARLGRQLFDVREADRTFGVANGDKRTGKRLLTVGTDCAIGKKYTALCIHRELVSRGVKADFRATGQTGILIAGRGVPIDATISDFVAGAAEWLSPSNDADHWDVIEGQGSLFHPAYAGVSLGLLHGSQPDALVLCHDPSRNHIEGYPNYPIPSLERCMAVNLGLARLTNPNAHFVGVSLNTDGWAEDERRALIQKVEKQVDMPVFDPIATGVASLVDTLVGVKAAVA
jgi:uncharacterized NAD-dependent epimerase/dehydratase family protein